MLLPPFPPAISTTLTSYGSVEIIDSATTFEMLLQSAVKYVIAIG